MRDLTSAEKELIDRRRAKLDKFLDERMPVLADFVERLELPDPPMVLVESEKYLPALDQWLRDQVIEASDRGWVLTRLGYFAGEYLVQRLGGCWFLNDGPDTKYFARYVVGRFSGAANRNAMVDPFEIAAEVVDAPPGRSFMRLLRSVEDAVRRA
jgi:hypothetical protein